LNYGPAQAPVLSFYCVHCYQTSPLYFACLSTLCSLLCIIIDALLSIAQQYCASLSSLNPGLAPASNPRYSSALNLNSLSLLLLARSLSSPLHATPSICCAAYHGKSLDFVSRNHPRRLRPGGRLRGRRGRRLRRSGVIHHGKRKHDIERKYCIIHCIERKVVFFALKEKLKPKADHYLYFPPAA
jgi:hypothetical protein